MQQVSENSIMELIRQRGILRFSTLMVSFHLSSVEAISIVEEYQRRGILDAKGRYVTEIKNVAETEDSFKEDRELSAQETGEKQEETKKPEKRKTIEQAEKTKRQSAEKQNGTVKKPERKPAENRKKKKTKKLIRRDTGKPGSSEIEGQISLFDYLPFN